MEPEGRRRASDPGLYASAVLFAFAAAASAGAYRLGLGDVHDPGPGFVPFATATLLGLMAAGQLVRRALAGAEPGGPARGASRWGSVAVVAGTLLGTAFVLERVGVSVATFVMLLVLFAVVGRKRWWVALLWAAMVVAAIRLLSGALGLPLPVGPLGL